jgi:hypothetical protein
MFSVASIFNEIKNHDDAFRLFLSVAAKGEHQGGWENERIAALTQDPVLAAKIRRHGEDESKHGRIFAGLLRHRGLDTIEVPGGADYCMILEGSGIGLPHERLQGEEPLTDMDILKYLAHSRVTEQRAAEEVEQMVQVFGDDPEIGPAVRMIADDEVNHLSYCHEELLRFRSENPKLPVDAMLKEYAQAEIRTYRSVGLDFVRRMGQILGWNPLKRGVLSLGVLAIYFVERFFTWRRMVRLAPPVRPNAMGEG